MEELGIKVLFDIIKEIYFFWRLGILPEHLVDDFGVVIEVFKQLC
jgi:hypothetical protein